MFEYRNCSPDFHDDTIYVLDHVQRNINVHALSDGSVLTSYVVLGDMEEVSCFYYDGVFFWSLERVVVGHKPITQEEIIHLYIKKWFVEGISAEKLSEFVYEPSGFLKYDSEAFTVAHVRTDLTGDFLAGENKITVNNAENYNLADKIYIGSKESYIITDINEELNELTLDRGLEKNKYTDQSVNRYDFLCLFNEYTPFAVDEACMLYLRIDTGSIRSYNTSGIFRGVKAASFYNGRVIYINGNALIFFNPHDQNITGMMYINNLDQHRSSIIDTYALFGKNNSLYRLQERHAYLEDDEWKIQTWGTQFGFVTDPFTPQVYFVELFSSIDMVHKEVGGGLVDKPEIELKVKVFTQYRTPVSGRYVELSLDEGTLSQYTGETDANGLFFTTYQGTSTEGISTVMVEAN